MADMRANLQPTPRDGTLGGFDTIRSRTPYSIVIPQQMTVEGLHARVLPFASLPFAALEGRRFAQGQALRAGRHAMRHWNAATLIESARVGADSLRANPMRTVLSTTGVIIGVAALVAAFAITDGVDVWSRALIARESSVQDVAITPRTRETVNGRSYAVRGYPLLTAEDAAQARAEVPGVSRHVLTLTGNTNTEYLDRRAPA